MSIRKTNFAEGEFYHIYNRGNTKQKIFHDKQDYDYFISLLFLFNTEKNLNLSKMNRAQSFVLYEVDIKNNLISIGAYCLFFIVLF